MIRRNRVCGLQLSRLPDPNPRALLGADRDGGGNGRMADGGRRPQTGRAGVRR